MAEGGVRFRRTFRGQKTNSFRTPLREAVKNATAIEDFYGIEANGDVEVLIEKLGKKMGFLGKGAKVDVDRTARIVLRDWQLGVIK